MKDVERFCSFRGVNSAVVDIAFETFIEACSQWLADGYRVETPLGVFSPKIKLEGDFTDPAKVKGKDVKFVGIELAPSKHFLKEVKWKQNGFRHKGTSTGNSQLLDASFMEKALQHAMRRGFTTIRTLMACSGLKYHSAQRYLNRLCYGENPTLRCERIGNSYHYFPLQK